MSTALPHSAIAEVELPQLAPLAGWYFAGAQNGTLPDCSLIVPTYRRHQEVLQLLTLIDSQSDIPAEVFIVDGEPASTLREELKHWAEQQAPRFDLTFVSAPAGLTRQRNAGIDLATRDFIFFLDDDVHPHSGFFRAMRDALLQQPACGGVGGTITNEMDRPLSLRWRFRIASRLIPLTTPGTWLPCGTSVPRNLAKTFRGSRPVDIIPGGVSAWRREVFHTHRFSEFFQSYSQGEDIEMSLRVGRHWSIRWCGDAHVTHFHAPGGRPPGYVKGRMEVRNRCFIWKRHNAKVAFSDRLRFWSDIACVAAFDVLAFLRHPLAARHLAHLGGVLSGAISSIVSPPNYAEPPVKRRYFLRAPAKL